MWYRGRSALYCMQCNGCALTQREGAIFPVLVDEDKRPFQAHSKLTQYSPYIDTVQAQCITIHRGSA